MTDRESCFTQTKQLHHVNHGVARLLQVKDFFISLILVPVELQDGLELLSDFPISLLQLLHYSLIIPLKISIKPTKLCTILKGLISLSYGVRL